ncbi:MAG: Ig domain-containing protein [Prevotella sp.]|jgi:hypothetical protein|nr:Ig domain-containing protein [Prevotella sp.]
MKTFYLFAVLFCLSLTGANAQAIFYPDATNPTTFIYDFNEELGDIFDGYTAAGWLFNNTTSGTGHFWASCNQTGGVLSLYRAQDKTDGYYNYQTFVFSPALDVSTGKTLKMKYSTTGLNGTIQARVYYTGGAYQTVSIPVTAGEYVQNIALTGESVVSFNLSAGNGGTYTGPGYINIDNIQIGPDMPAPAPSILVDCAYEDGFDGNNLSDDNKTVTVGGSFTYASQADGILELRSGAISNTYQQIMNIMLTNPVDLSVAADQTLTLRYEASGYTAGAMTIQLYDEDGTYIPLGFSLVDTQYDDVLSLTGRYSQSGTITGFDYSKVKRINIVNTAAIEGSGSIKFDYIRLGGVPFAPASVPASKVGVAIAPVNMLANLCSCIISGAFSATGLPDGITINNSNGLISGTPTTANAKNDTAVVTITYDTNKRLSTNVYFAPIEGSGPGLFVIEAGETKTKTQYEAGDFSDIIIKQTDTQSGQLDLEGGSLTVAGKLKLQKTLDKDKWYPLGFPFALSTVWSNYYESLGAAYAPFDLTADLEYFVKDFSYSATPAFSKLTASPFTAANAGNGYAVAVHEDLNNTDVSFISEDNPVLAAAALPVSAAAGGYQLVANTNTAALSVTQGENGGTYYYKYDAAANAFVKPTLGETATIAPFEAVITIGGIADASQLHGNFSVEESTGIARPVAGDAVVSVRYYNLQGVEISAPVKAQVYIAKEVYKSGAVKVVKGVK